MPGQAWECLVEARGGTVAGLSSAAGIVFAATPAGIRRSSDGARTWSVGGAGSAVPFASVVLPSPGFAQDHTLYAGGRQGAYRSDDGGASWHPVLTGGSVHALAVSRAVLFAGTELDGVLRSENGGRTWTSANPGLLDQTVLALALSPRFDDDRTAFAGTTSGVYRSRNGGRSWRAVEIGVDEPAVQCLCAADALVLAGTEAAGLFQSADGGDSWTALTSLAASSVTTIARSQRGTLAAGTEHGIAVSRDGGASWTMSGADLGAVLGLTFLEDDVLLAALAAQGVARSADGTTWSRCDHGLHARLLVGLVTTASGLVAGDVQGGVLVSLDGGRTWTEHALDQAGVTSLASASDGSLFAATSAGLWRSPDQGATWQPIDAGVGAGFTAVAAGPARVVAALRSGGLLASDDLGATWQPITHEGTAVSLEIAANDTLFMATTTPRETVVWRLAAGRSDWQRWLVSRPVDVAPLAASPTHERDGVLFVGLDDRVLHPLRDAREVHGGRARPMWRSSPPADSTLRVTALAISPHFGRDRTVLAATSTGVFVSRDGGEQFKPWSEGLMPVSTLSLGWTANTVYALTLGGGVWRRAAAA